jgi:hypothetical protein
MAEYGPVCHQQILYGPQKLRSIYYFFGDGAVHILPCDPQCHELFAIYSHIFQGKSMSWSYGSWIYNYLCNHCLSPLTLWVRISLRRYVLDTTSREKVCQWLAAGRWFSPGTAVSSTNKTDHHDITEILLKVTLNTITPAFLSDLSKIEDIVVWSI